MVSAGYSTYGGSERKLIALLRAVEADAPLLRTALPLVQALSHRLQKRPQKILDHAALAGFNLDGDGHA